MRKAHGQKNADRGYPAFSDDGLMTIEMSEEDARQIKACAKEAGLPVQVYLRRAWGIADSRVP